MTTRRKGALPFAPNLPDHGVSGRENMQAALDAITGDSSLPPLTRLVAVAIARHANWDTGWAFSSLDTLAHLSGIARRNVSRHCDKLEEAGYVHTRLFGRPGHQLAYRCFLVPQWVSDPGS
jgi:hypothetical protein